MMGASDHEFVGDAAHINLEIEALHRRAREMPAQTCAYQLCDPNVVPMETAEPSD